MYVSDEVYGTITAAGHGCPWGWTRFVNIADRRGRRCASEFRLPENQPLRSARRSTRPRTSYSAHNPTLTQNIAFSTWHSGGFQAMDVTRPDERHAARGVQAPTPELADCVSSEPRTRACRRDDPNADRAAQDVKVVMWSYPVIQDGLIYVVDLRNGLYILKYNGPHEHEVNRDRSFLEGNSNQGDALCFEPVPGAANVYCDTQRDTGAGGTVPATLSLTLGGPATFGAFTPGVAREYTASTTANVISTAGDAAAERRRPERGSTPATWSTARSSCRRRCRPRRATRPTRPATFADVGSSAAPTPLLTYTGPVSNDAVTLGFKQAIGANDALRTGAYSKTLTFTLSTTTP